jgi:hypothetical protein
MSDKSKLDVYFIRLLGSPMVKYFGDVRSGPVASWVFKVLVPGLSAGVAGALITDLVMKLGDHWILVLAQSVLILMLFSVFLSVLKLISVTESRTTSSVSVSRTEFDGRALTGKDAKANTEKDVKAPASKDAFDYCKTILLRATQSIYVIGPHFPGHTQRPSTSQHDQYLVDAMDKAIARHLDDDPQRSDEARQFQYFRVIQFDPSFDVTALQEGTIDERAIGNASLAAHIKSAIELRNRADGAISLHISARPFVPSMPSVLVIDERYVFFSLPTNTAIADGTDPQLDYNFVFEVEDKTGNVPRHFIRMITQLAASSTAFEIKRVGLRSRSSI